MVVRHRGIDSPRGFLGVGVGNLECAWSVGRPPDTWQPGLFRTSCDPFELNGFVGLGGLLPLTLSVAGQPVLQPVRTSQNGLVANRHVDSCYHQLDSWLLLPDNLINLGHARCRPTRPGEQSIQTDIHPIDGNINNDANADPFNAMLLRRSMQYACMYARPPVPKKRRKPC